MRKNILIGAAAVAGVIAVTGAAFTNSNSLPAADVTRGYGSQTISGVAAHAVTYNTNTAEDTITSVGLVLVGDTTAKVIQIAFNDATGATCSGLGAYDATTAKTTYSCTANQPVVTAAKFALIAE
ncbi:MAG: hypothetical protein JWN08_3371 [Frankiales bacterium]|jgi:hypothetical protein|nr:hypothetical protein [Frankiales bacterium]